MRNAKEIQRKQQLHKWKIIGLCSFVYFISYFTRKDFSVAMAALINQNLIDKVTSGKINTGLFIWYAVGQVLCGVLADRFSPKLLLVCGLSVTGICNLFMPLAIKNDIAIPLWTINGFAQAFMWPPIVRILSDNLDEESFLSANLLVCTASHISTMVLFLYVPLCLEYFSWGFVFSSAAFLAFLALLFVIIGLSSLLSGPRKAGKATTPVCSDSIGGLGKIVFSSGVIPMLACVAAMGCLREGIESWLPTLYCEAFEKGEQEAILLSTMLPVFSMCATMVIRIAHRFPAFNNESGGVARLFAVSSMICIPILILLDATSNIARILCLTLSSLVCGVMHACSFLLISCVPGRFSKYGMVATMSGFCNAFVYLGAAISMYAIPVITQATGWKGTVLLWLVLSLAGCLISLLNHNKYSLFISE